MTKLLDFRKELEIEAGALFERAKASGEAGLERALKLSVSRMAPIGKNFSF